LVGEHGGLGRHDKQILVKEETQVRSFEHKEVPSPRPPVRVCTSSSACCGPSILPCTEQRRAQKAQSNPPQPRPQKARGAEHSEPAPRPCTRSRSCRTHSVEPSRWADGRPPGLSTLEEEETFFVVHARVDRRLLNVVAADESEVGYLDLAVLPSLCTRTSPAANLLVHLVRRSGAHHACPCKVPSSQRPARRQRHSPPLPLAAGP
jgi:hypothetical protein